MAIEARFDGVCEACGDEIEEGELIEFSKAWDAWVHEACHDDEDEKPMIKGWV